MLPLMQINLCVHGTIAGGRLARQLVFSASRRQWITPWSLAVSLQICAARRWSMPAIGLR